jgi:hypothetical protein
VPEQCQPSYERRRITIGLGDFGPDFQFRRGTLPAGSFGAP